MQVYEFTLVLLHLIKKQFCILRYLFHQTNLASHSKEKKGRGGGGKVSEFDSALYFFVVDTTSTHMIGSAPGSHGCACHCGWLIAE